MSRGPLTKHALYHRIFFSLGVKLGGIRWYAAWPLFAWGTGISLICVLYTKNDRRMNRNAEDILVDGTIISVIAGVVEEITFRWLFFLGNIVSLKITNFLFFGFFGFGIPEWTHLHILGPIVDIITLHGLTPYLFHHTGWAVGAAMIATNSFFRDGHKYQGVFGWTNSWFGGMFFFYLMFTYGLLAAIAVHFLYDFLIFLVRYIDAAIERAQGYV